MTRKAAHRYPVARGGSGMACRLLETGNSPSSKKGLPTLWSSIRPTRTDPFPSPGWFREVPSWEASGVSPYASPGRRKLPPPRRKHPASRRTRHPVAGSFPRRAGSIRRLAIRVTRSPEASPAVPEASGVSPYASPGRRTLPPPRRKHPAARRTLRPIAGSFPRRAGSIRRLAIRVTRSPKASPTVCRKLPVARRTRHPSPAFVQAASSTSRTAIPLPRAASAF